MPPSSRANLRRPRKEEAIISDIVGQVRAGELAPGDRLASIKDLCATYKVSQRIVDSAIGELVTRGIVVTRHRRGCFITADAPRRVQDDDADAPPTTDAIDASGARPALTDFLVPRVGKRTLTVFSSETLPPSLKLWSSILHAYATDHGLDGIELLSCNDGHLQDIMKTQHVDVVISTPLILQTVGAERFVNLTDLSAVGLQPDDLLPLVQERLSGVEPTIGAPFQITLPYLFVNRDLAADLGLGDFEPETILSLIETAGRLEPAAAKLGGHAMEIPSMHDFLMSGGAVTVKPSGEIELDRERALAIFAAVAESGLPIGGSLRVIADFIEGDLLFLRHCSYEAVDIAENARHRWDAMPLPHGDGTVDPCWLTVAAVSRQSALPQEALSLVRHLVSHDVQLQFAQLQGNHSARADVAFHPDALRDHPVAEAVQRRALEHATLSWPEGRWVNLQSRIAMISEVNDLIHGRITPAEALARLEVYLAFDA